MSCSIDGCDNPVCGHGWCSKHYQRWRKWGDPKFLKPRQTLAERLDGKYVEVESGCWEWTASLTMHGYGQFPNRSGWPVGAHRAVWLLHHGSLPPEPLELDHLCRNRKCVNPSHLEPVTHRVNALRGERTGRRSTVCPQGHPYEGENLYLTPGGHPVCRTCSRASARRYKSRKKAEREIAVSGS